MRRGQAWDPPFKHIPRRDERRASERWTECKGQTRAIVQDFPCGDGNEKPRKWGNGEEGVAVRKG